MKAYRVWLCVKCDMEYADSDQDSAEQCCMFECENCGEWYEEDKDAKECCQETP